MGTKLGELLKKLDFIGNKIEFNIGSNRKFTTLFGSFLSCSVLGVIVWILFIRTSDIILQSTVYINSYRTESNDIALDLSGNFPFAFGFVNSDGSLVEIPENYFNITAYLINNNYSMDTLGNQKVLTNLHPIEIGRCDFSNDFNDISKIKSGILVSNAYLFSNKSINNMISKYLCLKQTQFIKLVGFDGSNGGASLSIFISSINNSSDIIKNIRMHIISPDYNINPYNVTNPGSMYTKSKYHYITYDNYQRIYLSYNKITYQTDSGHLFPSLKTVNFYKNFEYSQSNGFALYNLNKNIFKTYIYACNKEFFYRRI